MLKSKTRLTSSHAQIKTSALKDCTPARHHR